LVGLGGTGLVYKGWSEQRNKNVAIKILGINTGGRMEPGKVTQEAAMQEVTLLSQFTSSSFVQAELSGDKMHVMIVTDFFDNQPFHVPYLLTLILHLCDAFFEDKCQSVRTNNTDFVRKIVGERHQDIGENAAEFGRKIACCRFRPQVFIIFYFESALLF